MTIANVSLSVRFGKNYYKLKKDEKVVALPKDLEKSLLSKNYIKEEVVKKEVVKKEVVKKEVVKKPASTKKRHKEVEVIPEETINVEEISEVDFELDIPKEEHKIKEERIFNYRKEDIN